MTTKKDRRHSGYVTPRATVAKKDLEEYSLFVHEFYDDWADYRDGFRDWFSDFKKIKNIHKRSCAYSNSELLEKRTRMNRKQNKLLKRRKLRKSRLRNNLWR